MSAGPLHRVSGAEVLIERRVDLSGIPCMTVKSALAQTWLRHRPAGFTPWRLIASCLIIITVLSPPSFNAVVAGLDAVFKSAVAASWAQAIGSVAAVFAAIWIATDQHRQNRIDNADALRADRYAAIALSIHASSQLRGLVIALRSEQHYREAASGSFSTSLLVVDRHLAAVPPHLLRDRHGLEQYAQVPGLLLQARNWLGTLEINLPAIPAEEQYPTARMCADGIETIAEGIERKAIALGAMYGFVGVSEHVYAVGRGRYAQPTAPVETPDITHPEDKKAIVAQ